jgi:hypothetical protein
MAGAGVAAQMAKCVASQSLAAASHPPHTARTGLRAVDQSRTELRAVAQKLA